MVRIPSLAPRPTNVRGVQCAEGIRSREWSEAKRPWFESGRSHTHFLLGRFVAGAKRRLPEGPEVPRCSLTKTWGKTAGMDSNQGVERLWFESGRSHFCATSGREEPEMYSERFEPGETERSEVSTRFESPPSHPAQRT